MLKTHVAKVWKTEAQGTRHIAPMVRVVAAIRTQPTVTSTLLLATATPAALVGLV